MVHDEQLSWHKAKCLLCYPLLPRMTRWKGISKDTRQTTLQELCQALHRLLKGGVITRTQPVISPENKPELPRVAAL